MNSSGIAKEPIVLTKDTKNHRFEIFKELRPGWYMEHPNTYLPGNPKITDMGTKYLVEY